ncbi:MAG: DUF2333 family protein [Alphaproteobacteria bacterium]|nr:DUF2333 family protein [Alphaproteobacteria bacterium]
MQTTLLGLVRRLSLWLVALFFVGVFVYYIVLGLAFYQKIDDNPDFQATDVTPGGSAAVDMANALITREVETHAWVANDPWFVPSVWLTRTPAYQQGIVYALSRFAISMTDSLARQRGSSAVDPDLDKASGLLKYSGDVWVFNFKTSILPTATSEQQYKSARKSLIAFNQRLASGQATFERRADNLQAAIESISADLGSQSAIISDHIEKKGGGLLEFESNTVFFNAKGRLYAYYLILRELGRDFAPIIKDKDMENVWNNALGSLREAAELNPLIIFNGRGDSQFLPCHLCAEGFWLLRARTQLREVASIITK